MVERVIAKSILDVDDFYNLRIYAVFDENELDTRFIKANIKRYIDKEPMVIHQDKFMSFFYMKDLVKLVRYYIDTERPYKELDCCYSAIYSLDKIANTINELDSYKVDIHNSGIGFGPHYYGGNLFIPNIEFIGLTQGIKETYNKIKSQCQ